MHKKSVIAVFMIIFSFALFSCKGVPFINQKPDAISIEEAETSQPPSEDEENKEKRSQAIEWKSPLPFGIKKNRIPNRNETKSNDKVAISSASYPSFHGLPNQETEKKVNQLIKQYMDNELAKFWDKKNRKGDFYTNIYLGHYQILSVNESICSILFHRYGYRWTESHVMNIDLQKGKLLKPEDFFEKGYDYFPVMRAFCIKDLTEQRLREGRDPTNMPGKLLSKFEFNVTGNGFYAYFNEIFSHATGDYAVLIPFDTFGEKCLLKTNKSLYGYLDCPEGWKSFDEDIFFIKYPALLDVDGSVINMSYQNKGDDGSVFSLQIPVQNAGTISIQIQQKQGWDANPIHQTDKNKLADIDSAEWEETFQSTENKEETTQRITVEEQYTYRTVLTKIDKIEYWIIMTMQSLPLEDVADWKDSKETLYYYANQIFSTFEF